MHSNTGFFLKTCSPQERFRSWFLCSKRCIFSRGDSRKFCSYPCFNEGLNHTSQRQEDVLKSGFSDLAVGLLPQAMAAIIHAVILKMVSGGENLASFCPTVLSVHYYFSSLLATASFLNVIVIAVDRLLAVSLHLRYQELITPKRVTKVLLFVWLTSCIIASTFIFLPKGNGQVAVAISLVGYVLTTVAYVRIYKVVKYHQNQIYTQNQLQK